MPRGRPRKKKEDVLLKSAELLGWALGGLEREIAQTRERLTALTAEAGRLRNRLGGAVASGSRKAETATTQGVAALKGVKRRRNMSPEGRKKISDMMKKRWADRRKKMAKA